MSLTQGQTGSSTEANRAGKRRHERLSLQRDVHLCWGNQVLRARAINISRFGLLVEAERPIVPGTAISVHVNSAILGKACVRHCTATGTKYRIGLHMPDPRIHNL